MGAYVIVYLKDIKDTAMMSEYRGLARRTLEATKVTPRVFRGKFEVLEGEPVEQVVMLEFPTFEEAKAWYYSPDYQDALKLRLAASGSHAVLVEGL